MPTWGPATTLRPAQAVYTLRKDGPSAHPLPAPPAAKTRVQGVPSTGAVRRQGWGGGGQAPPRGEAGTGPAELCSQEARP